MTYKEPSIINNYSLLFADPSVTIYSRYITVLILSNMGIVRLIIRQPWLQTKTTSNFTNLKHWYYGWRSIWEGLCTSSRFSRDCSSSKLILYFAFQSVSCAIAKHVLVHFVFLQDIKTVLKCTVWKKEKRSICQCHLCGASDTSIVLMRHHVMLTWWLAIQNTDKSNNLHSELGL